MTADEIRALRARLNESVETFGARFGRSGRTVEDWEQGRRVPDVLVTKLMVRLGKSKAKRPVRKNKKVR